MTVKELFDICDFTPGNHKIASVVGVNDMDSFVKKFKNSLKPDIGVVEFDCREYSDSMDLWHSIIKAAEPFGLVDPLYAGLSAYKRYVVLLENIDAFDDDGKPNKCLNLLCSLLKDNDMINPAICAAYALSEQLSPFFCQRIRESCLRWDEIDGEPEEIEN